MASNMQNMTYCGRIFQNPANHNELYINIGWNTPGAQIYPPYHEGMASFLPQAQYEALIHAAKLQFEIPPVRPDCLVTSIFCCCPLDNLTNTYFKIKVTAFNKNASAAIAAAAAQAGCSAKLDMVELATGSGGSWVDQNGSQLLVGHRNVPGGPPLGYNIVVNLASPPSYWPLSQGTQLAPVTPGHLLEEPQNLVMGR
jgi:hypothetical protein